MAASCRLVINSDARGWHCAGCSWAFSYPVDIDRARDVWEDSHDAQGNPDIVPGAPRQSRDETLMLMAEAVAGRSTCSRLHVGAIIARNHRAVSSGYNGRPAGMPHCKHLADEASGCKQAVHAEANAIAWAARYGAATGGAELFTTHQPCLACAQLIVNAGITRVVFAQPYRKIEGLDLLNVLGITTMMINMTRSIS